MEAVHLFLKINKPGLNNEWNTKITAILKALPTIGRVDVIEENESSYAQISITYNAQVLSIDEIEKIVIDSGASISDINIHFPSEVIGITSPYGASAVSIIVDEKLKKIDGVLNGAISSKGELKVVLDTSVDYKQVTIDEIFKTFSLLRFGNSQKE